MEITLWLNNLVDLKYDIFECGANAEAFSSPELRADVLASLLRALKRYET